MDWKWTFRRPCLLMHISFYINFCFTFEKKLLIWKKSHLLIKWLKNLNKKEKMDRDEWNKNGLRQ